MDKKYKVVPVEPTHEMAIAAVNSLLSEDDCPVTLETEVDSKELREVIGKFSNAFKAAIEAFPTMPDTGSGENESLINRIYDIAVNSSDPGLLREGIESVVNTFTLSSAPSVKESFDREAVRNAALEEAAHLLDSIGMRQGDLIRELKSNPAQSSGNPGQLAGGQAVSDTALLDWLDTLGRVSFAINGNARETIKAAMKESQE